MSINDEFKDMSPLERRVAKLSIKYQTDLMDMKISEVQNLISESDWYELEQFMKNGCREITLH